jgi:hypothetical protein
VSKGGANRGASPRGGSRSEILESLKENLLKETEGENPKAIPETNRIRIHESQLEKEKKLIAKTWLFSESSFRWCFGGN